MAAKGEKLTDLTRLYAGENYIATGDCYLITEDNSLSDVIRWLLAHSDYDEIMDLLKDEHIYNLKEELENLEIKTGLIKARLKEVTF